MTVVIMKTAM